MHCLMPHTNRYLQQHGLLFSWKGYLPGVWSLNVKKFMYWMLKDEKNQFFFFKKLKKRKCYVIAETDGLLPIEIGRLAWRVILRWWTPPEFIPEMFAVHRAHTNTWPVTRAVLLTVTVHLRFTVKGNITVYLRSRARNALKLPILGVIFTAKTQIRKKYLRAKTAEINECEPIRGNEYRENKVCDCTTFHVSPKQHQAQISVSGLQSTQQWSSSLRQRTLCCSTQKATLCKCRIPRYMCRPTEDVKHNQCLTFNSETYDGHAAIATNSETSGEKVRQCMISVMDKHAAWSHWSTRTNVQQSCNNPGKMSGQFRAQVLEDN